MLAEVEQLFRRLTTWAKRQPVRPERGDVNQDAEATCHHQPPEPQANWNPSTDQILGSGERQHNKSRRSDVRDDQSYGELVAG